MTTNTNTTTANNDSLSLGDAAARQAKLKKELEGIQKVFPELAKRCELEIRVGEKGYLYITDPSFKAISKAGKEYQVGINMNVAVAKTFLNNDAILNKVRAFLKTDMQTPVSEFNLTA